jgi:hypothetical protein
MKDRHVEEVISMHNQNWHTVPGLVKKLGYKDITQSILVARTPAMLQNGSKCYF